MEQKFMRTGLISGNGGFRRDGLHSQVGNALYDRLRREVAFYYETELDQAGPWKRSWLNWKIDLLAEIRYNKLLFLK